MEKLLRKIGFPLFLMLGIVSCQQQETENLEGEKELPNIVILFADDQGTLDVGCFGSTDLHTPHLDKLAQNGVRFTQAYAHTVCCPARASLLTGRYPQRSNVNSWTQNVPSEGVLENNMYLSEVTLAEVVKPLGYQTGLFGKWHVGGSIEHGPMSQGFDEFYGIRGGFIDNYLHYMLHGKGQHDLWDHKEEIFEEGKYFPDLITQRALDFIDRKKDAPFLMYVGFNIPHYPEQADAKFDEMYDDVAEPRKSYGKIVSTVDDRAGQILGKLESLGLSENTLVFFISDNGHSNEDYQISVPDHASGLPEGLDYGAHGGGGNTGKWKGAKGSYFEGGVRVPAIISYPKAFPKNESRDQLVTIMDLLPTICEVLDVPLPEKKKIDGKSLVPIVQSTTATSAHQAAHFQWRDSWAVREGDWKLIINGREDRWAKDPEEQYIDSVFLANLADELPERKNHAEENPEVVEHLTSLHETWAKDVAVRD